MKRFLKYTFLSVILIAMWIVVILSGTDKGWWYAPFTQKKEPTQFVASVQEELHKEFVGNMAIAVFKEGKLVKESFHSSGKTIDRNTIFQVASLSKFVSAIGVMRLVQEGKLDLDVPISCYLTRWQLPESDFDNNEVTVRRLLSHTAGLTDGLGYAGFENIEDVQTLVASLNKAQDTDSGSSGIVKVGVQPGSEWKYSGGGFTLLQLLVEEVSGQTFDAYMRADIFEPLQMQSSFYQWDETFQNRLSDFHQTDGSEASHRYYISQAATSLYTTLADLEKLFLLFDKKDSVQKPLKLKFREMMWQVEAKTLGAPIYGLGTFLYAEIGNGRFVLGHDGKNNPPINTAFRYNPVANNGIIILTTGSTDFATRIASDWVFTQTGKVDALLFAMQLDKMIHTIVIGAITLLILVISIALIRRMRE